ncbi:MAG TPA: carboxypeptidase regulatory-like domain-containing protein, partial [Terriglobia bacterium]|nr:carboxypeptidase regulatory-like domain-containing protein [Terriglobia bacterium]
MRVSRGLLAVALVLVWTAAAAAQVTTGTIHGTVNDATGAVLPGVKLEIVNEATGAVRITSSDAGGRYSAPLLPVGSYKVTASIEGFQTEVRSGVVLRVGQDAVVDMRLQVGQVTQTVEVTGEAPLVQTTESTVSYVVEESVIRELPLNGRDLSQLILLNPGVNQSQTAGSQAYNGYGKRISISGMRGEDNTYLMDGQLIGDFRRHIPAGPSGALLGLESVQEFQVLTNSFSAQYGRALGGVFNAVSKSGTNSWHGSAYEYLRNDKLDARNFFDRQESPDDPRLPPFRRNQFGATLGGPIRRDQTFFFVAYESTREVLTETESPITMDADLRRGILKANGVPTGTTVAVNPIMQPYIDQFPLPTPGGRAFGDGTAEHVYQYKQPTTEHFGQTRVDFPSLTASDSFFVRFMASDSEGNSSADWPGFEQVSSNGSWAFTLSETHIVSPAALNTVRLHFSRVFPFDTGTAPPPGPGITVVPGQSDPPEIS